MDEAASLALHEVDVVGDEGDALLDLEAGVARVPEVVVRGRSRGKRAGR